MLLATNPSRRRHRLRRRLHPLQSTSPVPFQPTSAVAAAMVESEDRSYVRSLICNFFQKWCAAAADTVSVRRVFNRYLTAVAPRAPTTRRWTMAGRSGGTCSMRGATTCNDGGRGPIRHCRVVTRTISPGRNDGFGERLCPSGKRSKTTKQCQRLARTRPTGETGRAGDRGCGVRVAPRGRCVRFASSASVD